jgi:hypothetical protein
MYGEALALLGGGRKIVAEFEEAFEEPRFGVEAVIGENGLRLRDAAAQRDQSACGRACEERPARDHKST